ncbi:probable flavin-containing monooxygenase 1 [Tanacetum coccineum]
MSPGINLVPKADLNSDSDTVASPRPRAENEPRGQNELSRKQKMSADVARGHGGDGGGDDRPPPYQVPTGCGGCLGNRGKGTRKPNLGGRRAGRLHTRQETRNLGLKAITDKSGPVPIRFEVDDRETLMPLGDHAAHWANYLGELVRELPLHYPSWRQMPPERKAGVVAKIGTQFDLRPHMESDRWPQIYAGIQQHLQKIYNGKKAALKERYWVPEEDGTYDLERIRRGRPSHISEVDWDAQLAFWNDPKNLARAAQNKQNRAKSKVVCRQGSRSIAALQDMHMETSATREYPSLIHTFFLTHTVGGVFLNPEDKALYDEMLRLQGLGSNTSTGVPYTEDEIMAIVREGKQRGHIPGVGRCNTPKLGRSGIWVRGVLLHESTTQEIVMRSWPLFAGKSSGAHLRCVEGLAEDRGTIIPPPTQITHPADITRLQKEENAAHETSEHVMRLFKSNN